MRDFTDIECLNFEAKLKKLNDLSPKAKKARLSAIERQDRKQELKKDKPVIINRSPWDILQDSF